MCPQTYDEWRSLLWKQWKSIGQTIQAKYHGFYFCSVLLNRPAGSSIARETYKLSYRCLRIQKRMDALAQACTEDYLRSMMRSIREQSE